MADKTLDITPSWEEILPTWLMLYRQAITGDCTDPSLIRANAEAEFLRMAQAADKWNEHCRGRKVVYGEDVE